MTSTCTIEDLYKYSGVLADAKDKASEHVDEYKLIMSGASGGSNEKRLASQFIARFSKYFPSLIDQSFDVMMDLCEDSDVNIRKQAIKDLPALCRDATTQVHRVADVLTQLMQSDDTNELNLVTMSLVTLMRTNAKSTLQGIFTQIIQGDEVIRERAIAFIVTKLRIFLAEGVIAKDVEDELVAHCKKVLTDVTAVEFLTFVRILSNLPSMNTLIGRQQLVDIITEQADLDRPFDVSEGDATDRLIECIKQAMPLFSKNVHSQRFVEYVCVQVLPVLHKSTSADVQLELMKLLAEMICFTGEMDSTQQCAAGIFNLLLQYMPLPPSNSSLTIDAAGDDLPKLQFSMVECLMFSFHQIARRCPQFLVDEQNADRLKDFRSRLQYFARGVQVYIKQLRLSLQGKAGEALKTAENKIKSLALKTTTNINALIKDLFYNPPAYKASVNLSWKTEVHLAAASPPAESAAGQKRPAITPVTFDSDPSNAKKIIKTDKKIYAPPSGKFSEKAGAFRGRGGYQRRGGYRGAARGGYQRY